jgi:tetratricopeptide (TPR) repeat protein
VSLLGKLFGGGKTLESEQARADGLFAQEEFGPAKLAYESALALAKAAPAEVREALAKRASECADTIARRRIEAALKWFERDNYELGVSELRQAIDTAVTPAIAHEAEEILGRMQGAVALATAEAAKPEAEDRFELIAGSFEEDQYAEYKAHGARVEQALILLHDGQIADARAILEDELPKADAPRFLWFELGRARLASDAVDAGVEALRTFLSKLHAEEGGDARMIAHIELAQVLQTKGEVDAAVEQYEAALDAMPNDPRPYIELAAFLRKEGTPEEAIEVVQAGLDALDETQAPWRLWQELGLAQADAGHDAQAIESLERVIDFLVAKQRVQPPAEGTQRLAELYEKQGKAARALDMYSLLVGSAEPAQLCGYYQEAARLMTQLGLNSEARRALKAAIAAAGEDAELKARLGTQLEALPSN